MITRLRRRHRWLAPLSFALALGVLGAALSVRPTAFVDEHGGRAFETGAEGISLQVHGDGAGLDASLGEGVAGPDLAWYGAASAPQGDALPDGAVFLGRATKGVTTELSFGPEGPLESAPAFLVVHSLGWGRVVASAPVARNTQGGR